MPRRTRAERRKILPDAKYDNETVSRLINRIMLRGKKSRAEEIVYGAFDIMEQQGAKDPASVFEQAVRNVTPQLEVKPRRVGGATYQVPVEVRTERALSLALRYASRKGPGREPEVVGSLFACRRRA